MNGNAILKDILRGAILNCCAVEGVPSCATCAHASPVPCGESGSERNVYCGAVDYSEYPNGVKVRRTGRCRLYVPDARTVAADIVPYLREACAGWGVVFAAKGSGVRNG